jgi:DNA-binding FadR family transcriptional regulator
MNEEADTDPGFELKLDPGKPLPEVIADALRVKVEDGSFKPGAKLPNESELSRQMKVARSSVRTALQRLEAQGVLQVRRGLGWYVKRTLPGAGAAESANLGDYRDSELFEMRIGLEGLAASMAAWRAEEGHLADIAKRNEDYRAAGEAYQASPVAGRDERLTELLHADRAFHDAIVAAAGNRLLEESYGRVVYELQAWRERSYRDGTVCRRSWREHEKVIRFLNAHDSGGARMAMNAHLQHLYDELPELPEVPLDTMESAPEEPSWHLR